MSKTHGPRTQVEQAYALAHDNHLKVVEKPPGRWNVFRITPTRLVFLFRTARPAELFRRVELTIRAAPTAPRPCIHDAVVQEVHA